MLVFATATRLIGLRAFYDYVEHIMQESRPGLSRPSTPCLLICRKKDVDARDKRGHDAGERDSIMS
jgi:hypothetical protein